LATLISAVGVARTKLSEQTIVLYGAGSAGLGIVRQVRDAMVALDGIDKAEATKRFWLVDKHGLVTREVVSQENRPGWEEFARDRVEGSDEGLLDVVKRAKATVLIGTSTHGGGFTEDVIKALSANTEYPVILPLSNPSRLVEVEPQRAMEWSEGRALIATGSPFPEVDLPNGKKAMCVDA
jgi:malate dehydrogenase (oxaloacetate-decarboxylating)